LSEDAIYAVPRSLREEHALGATKRETILSVVVLQLLYRVLLHLFYLSDFPCHWRNDCDRAAGQNPRLGLNPLVPVKQTSLHRSGE